MIGLQLANERSTPAKLARVFPRRTKATPDDEMAFVGPPDLFTEAEAVHISVTFSYDRKRAEWLADQWKHVAPVAIGGVGWNDDRGDDFVPGRYIKRGYVFTSRGCPRRCWFCKVHLRDPIPRLLPIVSGWNVLDDNLLACPRRHVEAVFAMLRQQKGNRIEFTGGLEAKSLKDYQVGLLADLKPRPTCFWAYDPGDEFETLRHAAKRLIEAGFTARSHDLRCYVLIGFPAHGDDQADTFESAEERLKQMLSIGFTPTAMLYRDDSSGIPPREWREFQRAWFRPALVHSRGER